MTFEAHMAAFTADSDTAVPDLRRPAAKPRALFPAHDEVADPEAGWAARHPDRALAFLFVSPRDCAALDELMAA
jgi:hypothetical protein